MGNTKNRGFDVVGRLTDDGRYIELTHYKALRRVFKHLMNKDLDVSFKELEYQRSAAQNRWLWGVAYITIAAWFKETQGEVITKDEIHAHTLQNILDYRVETKEVFGTEVIVVHGKSTSALTTKQFSVLKEKLQKYWGEKGCEIADPIGNNFITDHLKDE